MRFVKKYWYLIIQFLIFVLMFYMVPPVADRWMEETMPLEIGDFCRYLWSQLYWLRNINVRFLSNIFSCIIDRNYYVRSVCNAVMLTCISALCIKFAHVWGQKELSEDKWVIGSFSGFCLMLVSWGIQAEVYFYASTLYLSAFLMLCLILWLDIKVAEKRAVTREVYFLYVLIPVGCFWLESNIFQIVATTWMIWILKCWKGRKIDKATMWPAILSVISAIVGTFATLVINKTKISYAIAGEAEVGFSKMAAVNLINSNSGLLIIFSTVILLNIWKKIKEKRIDKRFKGASLLIQTMIWMALLLHGLVLCGIRFYNLIKIPPKTLVAEAYGWAEASDADFEIIYTEYLQITDDLLLPMLILACISLIYVIFTAKKELVGMPLLIMGIAGTVVVVFNMYSGDRITASFIFSMILLIGVLAQNVFSVTGKIRIIWKGVFVMTCISACISMESIFTFLHAQNNVDNERKNIAEEVKKDQNLGMWDYDSFAVMPRYNTGDDGKSLMMGERKNPLNSDPYYPYLLNYYHLNSDTKLLFSDSDSQLVEIVRDGSKDMELYVNTLHRYKNPMYKFQVLERDGKKTNILDDALWSRKQRYNVPQTYIDKENIIFKCYIKVNNCIVEEIESSKLIWKL